MEDNSLARVAEIIGAEMGEEEGGGERKRGAEGGAVTDWRRDLRAETGQRGEEGREGIWTT